MWQNGYKDKYLKEVRSIKVGDRIAIKSSSTPKKNLPFDARDNTVSKMSIKAVGTVVANRGDGRTVEVEWEPNFKPKDWFFYTDRRTIWRLQTDADYQHSDLSSRLRGDLSVDSLLLILPDFQGPVIGLEVALGGGGAAIDCAALVDLRPAAWAVSSTGLPSQLALLRQDEPPPVETGVTIGTTLGSKSYHHHFRR